MPYRDTLSCPAWHHTNFFTPFSRIPAAPSPVGCILPCASHHVSRYPPLLPCDKSTFHGPSPRGSGSHFSLSYSTTVQDPRQRASLPSRAHDTLTLSERLARRTSHGPGDLLKSFQRPTYIPSCDMDLTPPSLTRSPVSPPNTYCASESSSLDYPSPGFLSQRYRIAAAYGAPPACSTALPLDTDNTLPRLACRASSEWSSSSIATPVLASSASTVPNVVSLDYDPFGSYDAHMHTSYGHDTYPAPPSAHESGSAHALHSPPSGMAHSPPLASSRVALPFPHGGGHTSSVASGQRIKLETYNDFGSGGIDLSGYTSPRAGTATYGSEDTTPYSGSAPAYFSSGHVPHWARSDMDVESTSYDGGLGHIGGLEQASAQQQQQARQNRPRRAPRRLTTREEANFQCEVKGCGKLFSRSYNFKAHMETHDDKREYPFPCQIGDCNKRFVRKTDLQRHHQSVHTKERNHKCDYCSRLFARKDTLRRHMEDGCSRRFDLGTLDLRSEGYNSSSSSRRQLPGTSTATTEYGVPSHGTLPPLLIGPAGGGEATPAQSSLGTRHMGPASDAGSQRRM